MQPQGQVVEIVLPTVGTCRCGAEVPPLTKVQFWRSSYGPTHDHVLSCPVCQRPNGLVPERMWLQKQRGILKNMRFGFNYGTVLGQSGPTRPSMPQELDAAWQIVEGELETNWRKINVVMMKLLENLPRCEDCSRYAIYGIKYGPMYCEIHFSEHPTAQELPWAKDLAALGVVGGG